MSDRPLEAFPGEHIVRHVCNTAGIERFPEAQFDMARLGVGLDGMSFAHQEQLSPCQHIAQPHRANQRTTTGGNGRATVAGA